MAATLSKISKEYASISNALTKNDTDVQNVLKAGASALSQLILIKSTVESIKLAGT
jgi:hypothetical protein